MSTLERAQDAAPRDVTSSVSSDSASTVSSSLEKSPKMQASKQEAKAKIVNVVIGGPGGAGKTTQCLALARRYGCVYVHFKMALAELPSCELKESVQQFISARTTVPWESRLAVLTARLSREDCVTRGFALDVHPIWFNSPSQVAELCKQFAVTRFVLLSAPVSVLLQRVLSRPDSERMGPGQAATPAHALASSPKAASAASESKSEQAASTAAGETKESLEAAARARKFADLEKNMEGQLLTWFREVCPSLSLVGEKSASEISAAIADFVERAESAVGSS